MPKVYVTRVYWEDAEFELAPTPMGSITVYEREPGLEPTGLLNKDGEEIMSYEPPHPCGFVTFDD